MGSNFSPTSAPCRLRAGPVPGGDVLRLKSRTAACAADERPAARGRQRAAPPPRSRGPGPGSRRGVEPGAVKLAGRSGPRPRRRAPARRPGSRPPSGDLAGERVRPAAERGQRGVEFASTRMGSCARPISRRAGRRRLLGRGGSGPRRVAGGRLVEHDAVEGDGRDQVLAEAVLTTLLTIFFGKRRPSTGSPRSRGSSPPPTTVTTRRPVSRSK
jgi:hypothetical protein